MHIAEPLPTAFDQPALLPLLDALDDEQLDAVSFGVIGFDAEGTVQRYGAAESRMACLSRSRVVGLPLFGVVAPCMNNYLIAQRFEDCAAAGLALDETVDYVLTLRMKPVKVQLRLLAEPARALRYVCILRRA
jgi:photoactive yellow protein